ncbi:MAG: A24 family peptidase [Caulobacter sp.]|nr:A24 family peptidase [Caulobacter sp.]
MAWAALAGPGGWLLAASGLLAWVLSALALVDVMTFRLPNLLTYPLILAGLLVSIILPQPDLPGHLIGALAGFGSLALVGAVYRRLRGREGLGLGDAKLMAAGGAWLGWQSLPTVLLAACACAMLWLLFEAARNRRLALGQPIAFGPPLCAGIWLVWLYGPLGGALS